MKIFKFVGIIFLIVAATSTTNATDLIVNGNFADITNSKEWDTKSSAEFPRVKNTWNLLLDTDPNLDNSPRLTAAEGINDGVWYKIGSQRAFVKATYHNLSGNFCMGLGASDKGASRGATAFQNISTSLNSTKKYTLRFKAAQLKDVSVGSGSAIGDNKTQVNHPLMLGLVDISQNHNADFDNGSIWTNGIMYQANSVTLTTSMSYFVVVMDLPEWVANSFTGTVSNNQLKMALRFSIVCPAIDNIAQAIVDDVSLEEFVDGDTEMLVGEAGGDIPEEEEQYTPGMSDYEKFQVNYRNTQEIIPSRSVSDAYLSYDASVFNIITGVPTRTLNDNDYDAHKAYWQEVYDLAALYGYANFYPTSALALANYTGKAEILNLIVKTVNWYFDNNKQCSEHKYHETYSYQDNGHIISIIDRVVGLLENEVKTSVDADVSKAINAMLDYGDYILDSGNQIKGANYSLRFDHAFRHVYVSQDSGRLDRFRTAISNALTYTLPEEQWAEGEYYESDGFYPDGMFFHHGDMCYWSMYGEEFLHKMIWVHDFTKNTTWAHSTEEWNTLAFLFWEGARQVSYRGNPEYSSGPKRASALPGRIENATINLWHDAHHILHYAQDDVNYKAEMTQWLLNHDTIPEQQATDASKTELDQHKYFWYGEYQIHRRNNYFIAVRRNSQRVRGPEDPAGGRGPMQLHYGSGYTPILQRGDEYRIARLGWNWLALPGTTNEMVGKISGGGAGNPIRGRTDFSGGLQEDKYGCGAFIYDLGEPNSAGTDYDPINGAIAKKSNFFFDEGMLCTGTGVSRGYTIDGQKADIVTTINQMRSETDVYYAIGKGSESTLTGSTNASVSETITNRAWFWHSNTGYVVMAMPGEALTVETSIDMREINSYLRADESWSSIFSPGLTAAERTAERIWMWQLSINHGLDPSNQKYIYIVLPNFTKEQTAAYCADPKFTIESLGDQHVIYHKELKMYQAVFFEPGEVNLVNGGKINSEVPVIMQLRRKDDTNVVFTAQNPKSYALASDKVPLGISEDGYVGVKYNAPITVKYASLQGFSDKTMNVSFDNQRLYEGKFITTDYTDVQTSAKYIKDNVLKVRIINNEILFEQPTENIFIYDMLGRCIYYREQSVSRIPIDASWNGCYLIRTENYVRKVLL